MFLFAEGADEAPLIVQFINHYLGEPVYRFEMAYTRPIWAKLFASFHTTPEKVFGSEYSPDNAIPWYTIMFILACIITVALIWIMKGKLSEDEPHGAQQTLEVGVSVSHEDGLVAKKEAAILTPQMVNASLISDKDDGNSYRRYMQMVQQQQ